MKKAIIIGSGAGGSMMAQELQGDFAVTILERGKDFQAFPYPINFFEPFRKAGLLFDPRLLSQIYPSFQTTKPKDGPIIVSGNTVGGTLPFATGNAVRADEGLRKIGIDLQAEYESLAQEIPLNLVPLKHWRSATKDLYVKCEELGLAVEKIPKFGNFESCRNCGLCILGCKDQNKWDNLQIIRNVVEQGAELHPNTKALSLVIEDNQVQGVVVKQGWRKRFLPADLVVLAAGGLETPKILANSGLECQASLFVDPVLCVMGIWKNAWQNLEVPMAFAHWQEGYFIAPYFDYLSYFFDPKWRQYPPQDIFSLMIKLADAPEGSIEGKRVCKPLTITDKEKLRKGVELCKEILTALGINKKRIFLGTLNAGHPGGSLPFTAQEAETLQHASLPHNLYIADATVIPGPFGKPPILTVMAIAKKVAARIKEVFG